MGIRNDNISLKLAKAVKTGFLPDVYNSELDILEKEAKALFSDDTGLFVPSVVVVDLGSFAGEVLLDSATGATTYLINDPAAIPLPSGWTKMDVAIMGYVQTAVKATTTTNRLINVNLRLDLVARQVLNTTILPVPASTETTATFSIAYAEKNKTASVGIRFEARMQGADSTVRTNGYHRSWGMQATCYRTE